MLLQQHFVDMQKQANLLSPAAAAPFEQTTVPVTSSS